MKEDKNLEAILESILFVYGEPLEIKRLAVITGANIEQVRAALANLAKILDGRGLVLIEVHDTWQLGTNPSSAPYLETLVKGQFGEAFSRAALETLAVIAYQGPLARVDIEYIRGVNSSFILRTLLMRGLIERVDNPKDKRISLWRVSMDLLRYFGLSRIEDLPRYEELRTEAEAARTASPPSSEDAGT